MIAIIWAYTNCVRDNQQNNLSIQNTNRNPIDKHVYVGVSLVKVDNIIQYVWNEIWRFKKRLHIVSRSVAEITVQIYTFVSKQKRRVLLSYVYTESCVFVYFVSQLPRNCTITAKPAIAVVDCLVCHWCRHSTSLVYKKGQYWHLNLIIWDVLPAMLYQCSKKTNIRACNQPNDYPVETCIGSPWVTHVKPTYNRDP